jgi:hypothetical protein
MSLDDFADLLAVGVPLDLCAPLRAGKLEQTCPACGAASAAIWYCYRCMVPTGPQSWKRVRLSEARLAARRANGHLRAIRGTSNTESAKTEAVA